jgi:hypothetical protein
MGVFASDNLVYLADFYSLMILRSRPTQIESDAKPPVNYLLTQNYPNPFNAQTTIQYDLTAACDVTISVFDILGRKVGTLVDETQDVGHHQVIWDAANSPSGFYFYRIQAGDFSQTKRALLLK